MFVLDKSGSMSGDRIKQLKQAMDKILDDLQKKDRYGVVTFESSAEYMFRMLFAVTNLTRAVTKHYVHSITVGGGRPVCMFFMFTSLVKQEMLLPYPSSYY